MTSRTLCWQALAAAVLFMPCISWAGAVGKLGPAIAADAPSSQTGADALLETCPAIAKWRFRPNAMGHNLDGFASRCPQSAIVLQPAFEDLEARSVAEDPAQAAQLVWNEMSLFQTVLMARDGRLWLEGPDADKLPDWQAAGAPAWLEDFWQALADHARASGVGLLVGLDGVSPGHRLDALVEMLEAQGIRHGFAHSAVIADLCAGEGSTALDFEGLLSSLPASRPLFLTRAGHARPGDVSLSNYAAWLTWFDAVLRQQPDNVMGAALHDFGSASPSAHDALDGTLAEIVSADTPDLHVELRPCAGDPGEEDPEELPDAGAPSEIPGPGAFRDADESGCSAAAGLVSLPGLGAAAALCVLRLRQRARAAASRK